MYYSREWAPSRRLAAQRAPGLRATCRVATRSLEDAERSRWLGETHLGRPPGDDDPASPYQRRDSGKAPRLFRDSLCLVEPAPRLVLLAEHPQAPLVVSHRSRQEKAPWKDLDSVTGNVERINSCGPVYLGAVCRAVPPARAHSSG